jgi:hypothetical protein
MGDIIAGIVLYGIGLLAVWRSHLQKKAKIAWGSFVAALGIATVYSTFMFAYGAANTLQPSSPSCKSYQAIGDQMWIKIADNINAYRGRCFTVYGQVSQWDYGTEHSFFAGVGGAKQIPYSGGVSYPTTAYLTGKASMFTNITQQDLFAANVRVLGVYTETLGNGQASMPELFVDSLHVVSDGLAS